MLAQGWGGGVWAFTLKWRCATARPAPHRQQPPLNKVHRPLNKVHQPLNIKHHRHLLLCLPCLVCLGARVYGKFRRHFVRTMQNSTSYKKPKIDWAAVKIDFLDFFLIYFPISGGSSRGGGFNHPPPFGGVRVALPSFSVPVKSCWAQLMLWGICIMYNLGTSSGTSFAPSVSSPVDCVLGPWGAWSTCSASCGLGKRSQISPIVVVAANGGQACPSNQQWQYCVPASPSSHKTNSTPSVLAEASDSQRNCDMRSSENHSGLPVSNPQSCWQLSQCFAFYISLSFARFPLLFLPFLLHVSFPFACIIPHPVGQNNTRLPTSFVVVLDPPVGCIRFAPTLLRIVLFSCASCFAKKGSFAYFGLFDFQRGHILTPPVQVHQEMYVSRAKGCTFILQIWPLPPSFFLRRVYGF